MEGEVTWLFDDYFLMFQHESVHLQLKEKQKDSKGLMSLNTHDSNILRTERDGNNDFSEALDNLI